MNNVASGWLKGKHRKKMLIYSRPEKICSILKENNVQTTYSIGLAAQWNKYNDNVIEFNHITDKRQPFKILSCLYTRIQNSGSLN